MCDTKPSSVKKRCNKCSIEKVESEFRLKGKYRQQCCKVCANNQRRDNYKNNESLRQKCINDATTFKKTKKAIREEKLKKNKKLLELITKNVGIVLK